MESGAGRKTAGKIVTVGVGLLLIAVLTLIGKFFMRGFFVGAAVAFVAIVGVLIWMRISMRGGGK
ncbi:MAG: hypothetical protein WC333_10725 [Dehalococcoidia bacterium]|jgi:hypothetical protein